MFSEFMSANLRRWIVRAGLAVWLCHLWVGLAFGQTTVSFRFWGSQQTADAMEALAADFERENPSIKIELIHSPSGAPDNLIVAVAGGVAPDASMVHAAYWAPLWEAIQPLDEFLDRFPNLRRENFIEEKWDYNNILGKQMGLPLRLTSRLLVYNKDAFDQAGVTGDIMTWDELADVAARLARFEGDRVSRWGLGLHGGGAITVAPGNFAARNGWRAFNDDYTEHYYRDPKLSETLEFLNGLVARGIAGVSQIGMSGVDGIVEDTAALVFQGSWWAKSSLLPMNPDLRLGYLPVPLGPSGEEPYGIVSGEEVVMLRGAKDKEATLKFLEYLTYTRNGDYARNAGDFFPVAWHAIHDPEWDTELWRAVIGSFGRKSVMPGIQTTVSGAFAGAVEAIYRQEKAVPQALAEIAELADADVIAAQAQIEAMRVK